MTNYLIIIYLILNIIVFFIYGLDKYKAIKHKERISEKSLILLALFAPLGAILGIIIFHHKTKKLKFNILIPLFIIIHILIYIKISLQ
jgi:uncharacterized membrane protein YsdA (DUF1294 family)